jgi:hypothetical protein
MLTLILVFCGIIITLNWFELISAMIKKNRNLSFAPPFLCGILASVTAYFHSNVLISNYFYFPLLLDPSIGFLILSYTFQYFKKFSSRNRGN